MAGEVEERILNAASAVFGQHGYSGASLEHIAEAAGASKATLYSRYSDKAALFSAVVKRNSERILGSLHDVPASASLEQRLDFVAQAIATRLLSDEVIALIRMVIADGPRFPMLAKLTSEAGRSRSIEAVATMMTAFSGQAFDASALAARKQHALAVTTQFMDAAITPLLMRALMGENVAEVRQHIGAHIGQTVAMFVNARLIADFL